MCCCELLTDLKAVKLYNYSEILTALWNNLRANGKSKGALSFRDLLPFDQNHVTFASILPLPFVVSEIDECEMRFGCSIMAPKP
jgi:hypothetical protein